MKINKFHSPYLLISLSSLSLHGSAPQQPQPNTSKSLINATGAAATAAGQPGKPSPTLLAAFGAANGGTSLDRRASAPPQLNLTAAAQAGETGALASPPSFSLDSAAGSALGSGRDAAAAAHKSRRPSFSAVSMNLGPNGSFVAAASPLLKPLSVVSPPHGTGTASQSGSSSQRRNSVSGAPNASPSLRPQPAPGQKNQSPREQLLDSQVRLASLAKKMAGELEIMKYHAERSSLSPRSAAVVKRDAEIYDTVAQAADYLMISHNAKRAALFPTNLATATVAAAANASTSPNSPPIAVTVVSSPLPGADAAAAKGASTDPIATAKK